MEFSSLSFSSIYCIIMYMYVCVVCVDFMSCGLPKMLLVKIFYYIIILININVEVLLRLN